MVFNMNQRVIEVVDYNSNWVNIFETERNLLASAIGNNAKTIEHIGSTSVRGLAAKPIIDILIEVKSINALDTSTIRIENLGFIVKGENGIAGRRYYQKGGNKRSHHVHAFQTGDLNLIRHRAFKEYLIAYPAVSLEYGQLKRTAALDSNNNIGVYMALKNDFILKYEQLAVEWFTKF